MWNEQKRFLESQLGPTEHLLWSGQPRQGMFLRASDAYLIPFSLMWGGFAIFWEVSVLSTGAPLLFKFWGVPFVLIGLYMMIGRFFVDERQRSKTHYGVTNERVIIVSGLFSRKTKSLNLQTLHGISVNEKTDLSGTILFGTPNPNSKWAGTMPVPWGPEPVPSFESIPEAKKVYEIIRNAQRHS